MHNSDLSNIIRPNQSQIARSPDKNNNCLVLILRRWRSNSITSRESKNLFLKVKCQAFRLHRQVGLHNLRYHYTSWTQISPSQNQISL